MLFPLKQQKIHRTHCFNTEQGASVKNQAVKRITVNAISWVFNAQINVGAQYAKTTNLAHHTITNKKMLR